MKTAPNFILSSEDLNAIEEQIKENRSFEKEIIQNDWCLDVSGTAECENFYEKETNSCWSDITCIEISIKVYDGNGDSFDFSDEFEKDIFDQINSISK